MPTPFTVEFQPSGLRGTESGAATLLELAHRLGLVLESTCGGQGTCRTCAVRIEGALPPPSPVERDTFQTEELTAGWRCACQTRVVRSCTVHVPARAAGSRFSAGKEMDEESVLFLDPIFTSFTNAGHLLRAGVPVAIVTGSIPLGLAVDLGTTNIAAAVLDLRTGRILGNGSKVNPQGAFGADVISRLQCALQGEAEARRLQRIAIEAISGLAESLTDGKAEQIAEVAIAGNTVMQHLLLGMPVNSLSRAPYRPAVLEAIEKPAADFDLRFAPGAMLYCAPNVAGFIGGDHLAALLAVSQRMQGERWAMIDIGTNTEIALYIDGRITSASCASGPAFEGGKLKCGMRAAPGAIDRVSIGEEVEISTIGAVSPIGICGSGVLSLAAALKNAGLVDTRGRMKLGHNSIRDTSSGRELVLCDNGMPGARPVVFTQDDVRALQLAKAAIRTGFDLLLQDAGVHAEDLDCILIAGAFGKFLNIEDAFSIGLLPDVARERVVQVGNAAGLGVCRLVGCAQARREVESLARRIRYLELAGAPAFQKTFIARSML